MACRRPSRGTWKARTEVIGLIGDGSSMYAIQGLWTAGQLQLPITFVIIKNGRYSGAGRLGVHFGLSQTLGPNCRRSTSLPLQRVKDLWLQGRP